jgi:hypothetical protein
LKVLQRFCWLSLKCGQVPEMVVRCPYCPCISGLVPDFEATLVVVAGELVVTLYLMGPTNKVQVGPLGVWIAGNLRRLLHDGRALKAAGDVANVQAEIAEDNADPCKVIMAAGLPCELNRLSEVPFGFVAGQLGYPEPQLYQRRQTLGGACGLCQPLPQVLSGNRCLRRHFTIARIGASPADVKPKPTQLLS